MKQKLLELLNAKHLGKGTRPDVLARLASAFALQCTTEEEATALVEKLTDQQVTDFSKEYRSEVDSEISKAVDTATKKKAEVKDDPNPTDPPADPTDIASIIAAAIKKANEPLLEEINSIKAGKTTESRVQQLEAALKDVAPELKQNTLKAFNRMNFESDESFSEYLTEATADATALNQTFVDSGLSSFRPAGAGGNQGDVGKLSDSEYDELV